MPSLLQLSGSDHELNDPENLQHESLATGEMTVAMRRLAFDALIDSGIGFIDTAEGRVQAHQVSVS